MTSNKAKEINKKDKLVGKRFGKLKVLSVYKKGKYKKCKCICDCGNTTDVYYSNLVSGRTVSCGCRGAEIANSYKNIVGEIYHDLIVEEKTEKREDGLIVWKCRCLKCGKYIEATKKQLDRGYVKDCGNHKYEDLLGQKIGELTVISFDKNREKYLCQCSCGKSTYVSRSNLISRHTLSCGHLGNDRKYNYVDGALPYLLTGKVPSNNTSGVKGVSQTKSGKWVSYITLRKKRYTLGTFKKKGSSPQVVLDHLR
ncbi:MULTISPECIES: AP2 domain-containing protein [Bacillales]|uniref:AP2 domain-containing protein n=1 Tax=Bacillales TaxID=1385 RepID=UPI0006A16AE4|nr:MULTISPECIES: AP2 domain-containing protein [Bacillales]KMY63400.1 hypothetical protein AA904_03500 [Geobacillus stearothermophilus]KMY63879.1 hypothetical protein AA905_04705 [Geobacillus stearothermophilus]GBX89551.1 hypothetical protein M6K003_2484 [Staphylococcus aureus]